MNAPLLLQCRERTGTWHPDLQMDRQRWREFFATYDSKASLKQAILRKQHISSPGDVGLRSLCWKVCIYPSAATCILPTHSKQLFLYLPDFAPSTWSGVLTSSRDVFTTLRAKLLGPLESGNIDVNEEDPDHPIDPLAEDPSVIPTIIPFHPIPIQTLHFC